MKIALSLATGVSLLLAAPAANAYAMMYCLEGHAYVVTCSGPNNDQDCWTSAAGGCVGSWAIELDLSAIVPDAPTRGSPRDGVRQAESLLRDWRPDQKSWIRPSERFMAGLHRQGVQGRLAVPASRISPYMPDTTAISPESAEQGVRATPHGGASGGVPPLSTQAKALAEPSSGTQTQVPSGSASPPTTGRVPG